MFRKLFPKSKSIIGMIALPPLNYGFVLNQAIDRALADLDTLQSGGVDGVCVENDYDQPHQITIDREMVESFKKIAQQVMTQAKIPVGVQVLLNDWRASLEIAKSIGAQFVRLDFFVDRVQIAAGVIEPEPEAIIAYRKRIAAEHVALFTDVQVKHSEMLEPDKTLSTSTQQAIVHGADALIVTGKLTGEAPNIKALKEVRNAAGNFPILIGSGTTAQNVADLFQYADGAIVGTSLKQSKAVHEMIMAERVQELIHTVEILRKS
ncbi:MAG TPA: BtpA/SgcQ family protein [Acidobacteriota bacterium]|nr:BtpA/SgcQ family protein [Acidobacteriota bacterium]